MYIIYIIICSMREKVNFVTGQVQCECDEPLGVRDGPQEDLAGAQLPAGGLRGESEKTSEDNRCH